MPSILKFHNIVSLFLSVELGIPLIISIWKCLSFVDKNFELFFSGNPPLSILSFQGSSSSDIGLPRLIIFSLNIFVIVG